MRAARLDINVPERSPSTAVRTRDLRIGAEREQRRREIAGIGGVATLALRRDVADVATPLQAESVRLAPPCALIVEDAARVEAEITADRRHGAVAGSGDRLGCLRHGPVVRRDQHLAGERDEGHAGADAQPALAELDPVELVDAGKIDQQIGTVQPMAHADEEVGAAGDETTWLVLPACGDGFGHVARVDEMKLGHRCAHDAALRVAASRVSRRRSTSASMTRSGVTGSSSRSIPIAFATALTRAGGKPASAPSLASLAPKGPYGS